MKILVSGASGLVGGKLVSFLQKEGHEVARLVRGGQIPRRGVVVWDPESGQVDPQTLEGFEVVIHLAGKNLAEHRWTKAVKEELFRSRCRDTWLLAQALARVPIPPKVVLTASAMGFYGDRGEELVDEHSSAGRGFLAELCVHWERATEVIAQNGTRVIHARFGAILDPSGGMLGKLQGPFRRGFGAVLGSGKQWMSWIGLDDVIKAIYYVISTSHLRGAINFCTNHPVRNEEFTQQFAEAFQRKARLRMPAPMLRLIFGDIAEELMLVSAKVKPQVLLESGFTFDHPTLRQLFQAFGWN